MEPLTAITQIGSLVGAVRSLAGGLHPKKQTTPPMSFQSCLQQCAATPAQTQAAITRLFTERDSDKSGMLSAGELGAAPDVFGKLDTDADGQLSRLEVTAAVTRTATGASVNPLTMMVQS